MCSTTCHIMKASAVAQCQSIPRPRRKPPAGRALRPARTSGFCTIFGRWRALPQFRVCVWDVFSLRLCSKAWGPTALRCLGHPPAHFAFRTGGRTHSPRSATSMGRHAARLAVAAACAAGAAAFAPVGPIGNLRLRGVHAEARLGAAPRLRAAPSKITMAAAKTDARRCPRTRGGRAGCGAPRIPQCTPAPARLRGGCCAAHGKPLRERAARPSADRFSHAAPEELGLPPAPVPAACGTTRGAGAGAPATRDPRPLVLRCVMGFVVPRVSWW